MFYNLLLAGIGIAGFVVVFTKLRKETGLNNAIDYLPSKMGEAVRCPTCFSYWLSLGVVSVIDLGARSVIDWNIPDPYLSIIAFLASWYALGFVANVWRMLYQILWKGSLYITLKTDKYLDEVHGH